MRRSVSERWLSRDQQEVARRQGWPYPGKLSARPAGKPGDFFLVIGEFATIPSTPPDSATINVLQSAPQSVFLRHGGIYRSDVAKENQPRVGTNCLPLVGPKTQGKERAGRNTLFSSSAMSSGRLFLDQVGRHQSPSPLRRHAQTTTHFSRGNSKPELSTLLGSGTFYFALTIADAIVSSGPWPGASGTAPRQFPKPRTNRFNQLNPGDTDRYQ